MTTAYKCTCGFNIPHTAQCLADNSALPVGEDPTRYGYGDLPRVGTVVGSPGGRRFKVARVISAARILCSSVDGWPAGSVAFQANDLRKVPQ